ncbi:MAG: LamG domain-containing protein [Sphingobacteriales bacterium]|nr:LamG domain-containing protein [Sphingobacteriales bacterium]
MKKNIRYISLIVFAALSFISCQKMNRPDLGNYPKDANPPGGPLKFYAAYDGTSSDALRNAVDSIRANFAASNPLSSITGITGKAVQGTLDKAIKYSSANDWANSTSISIAFWLKNTPWSGGPGFLFNLTDKDHWANGKTWMLIEDQGQSSTTQATVKFVLQDQWFEFVGAKKLDRPLLDGNWHHWAIVYDETTSKLTYYFDGQALTGLHPSLTDVKNGANPRGPLNLKSGDGTAGQLVVGGWNKQVGLPGPGDGWIQGFNGGLDQFRLYGKALSASEVLALFNAKL